MVNLNNNSIEDANNFASSVLKIPKNNFLRKCCGCGNIFPRARLLRITKDYKSGEIIINPDKKQFGRSVYLCFNKECLKIAIKKKRLQKSLKSPLSEEIIKKIENELVEKCT